MILKLHKYVVKLGSQTFK